jgi:uncharacterized 2Fe-2S/4Fe-4S cluster protein (DUF4445 family)
VSKAATIRFEPEGKKFLATPGGTVFAVAREAGVGIMSECGGEGSCGRCRVIIKDQSNVSEPSENEREHIRPAELSLGYRLACCVTVKGDMIVFVPPESRIGIRKIQVEGMERPVMLDPAVKKLHISLSKPTIYDVNPDFERLSDSLQEQGFKQLEIDQELLGVLPDILRDAKWNFTVTLCNNQRIISVEEGNTESTVYGFSVDIGTSKIVGYLVDLTSGNVISIKSLENPQIMHGEDILSRINYATTSKEGLKKLQVMVIEAINTLIYQACQEANVSPDKIYEIIVVGNTAMHHFFLGIQPKYLTLAPYVPAIKRSVDIKANSLEIKVNPLANIHVLPVIAGFVGADAVADILATGVYEMNDMCLLMDVGTNGEVFVGDKEDIVSCSCAAGPAFEGMHIRYGMKASTGAIERLKIDPDTYEVEYETIDESKPVGICGSGIVDAVAEMFRCGIINQRGNFNENIKTKRIHHINGEVEFVIAWKHETGLGTDITVSRKDIQEIQLAKAAMHTGAAILMREKKVTDNDLYRVFIAGAFGRYINPESARFIGLIPDVETEKINFVGNTAISGAKMVLTSREMKETAQMLSKNIRYIELMAAQDFRKEFINSIFLPYRDVNKYPRIASYFSQSNALKR